MALINTQGYYHLDNRYNNQCTAEWLNSTPVMMRHINLGDIDYYHIDFKNAECFVKFPLHTLINEDLFRQIKDSTSNVYLLASNSHEGFHSAVDPLYKYLIVSHHIPPEKVIFATGSYDILEVVERTATKYKTAPCKVMWCLDFELSAKTDLEFLTHQCADFVDNHSTLEDKKYHKKYLNFNRRWRPARPTFVGLLLARGLLDQGFVSFGPSDCGNSWPDFWNNIEGMNYTYTKVLEMLKQVKDQLVNLPPLYLDTEDLVTNRAALDCGSAKFYRDSYVSLVAETNFYTTHEGFEPGIFYSEKTFKPILFKHPFVFISTPGMLSPLRQLGYQTFSGIINEGYDLIENDGDRMLAVLDETQRLCNLSQSQLTEYLAAAREICDFNFDVLRKKQCFAYKLNF